MGRDGLLHHLQGINAAGERPGNSAALSGRRHCLQVDAGLAAKLMDGPLADDGQCLSGQLGIERGNVAAVLQPKAPSLA